VRLDYMIPTRGLIGFHNEFLSSTSGTGLMYHVYDHYGPAIKGRIGKRNNGVLIANCQGIARGFALFNLQERGRLFVEPQSVCYEGMLVGIHARDNDLVVNVTKEKQLTNMRASGTDENIILTPAIKLTLEQALEFIDDDELVEVTPDSIRLRKKSLKEHERKKASRAANIEE
jgi:GTP-binding protein